MSTKELGIRGFLKVARAQASADVEDIAYSVLRDYPVSTEEAFATAREIKASSALAVKRAQRELKTLCG